MAKFSEAHHNKTDLEDALVKMLQLKSSQAAKIVGLIDDLIYERIRENNDRNKPMWHDQ